MTVIVLLFLGYRKYKPRQIYTENCKSFLPPTSIIPRLYRGKLINERMNIFKIY